MNPYDRRRLALASIFTVAALPALWLINRNDPDSRWPVYRRRRRARSSAVNQAPTTSVYTPDAPIFLNGPPSGAVPRSSTSSSRRRRGDRSHGQGKLPTVRRRQQGPVHDLAGPVGLAR